MNKYLYEMHVHCSEVSGCAKVPASEVVANYINAGYDGLILTDHFNSRSWRLSKHSDWDGFVDYFMNGYNVAVEAANKINKDFAVLLGMEIRFSDGGDNDYLVYGIDETFLRTHTDLLDLGIENFRKVADDNGLLIYQAHPFRCDMCIVEAHLLDGIEVYNGNANHNSSNDIANLWAEKYNLRKSSGSDYNGEWGMTPGGIYTGKPIKNNSEFVEILRNREYVLK